MNIRPIKTAADHRRAITELTALLESAPVPNSPEADNAEVLSTLIERYEHGHFPVALPTPVEAVRFRMDQLDLAQKDLVPYIGSASKVSEVLNGKRPLSLNMIRALHRHLGIPVEVLIAEPGGDTEIDDSAFPLKEMHKRGYFHGAPARYVDFKKQANKWLNKFLGNAGVRETAPAYARSTAHYRSTQQIQPESFRAWQAKVLQKTRNGTVACYRPGVVDAEFMRQVAALSVLDNAPLLACEYLQKRGIYVVVERHLPRTYLDGAVFLSDSGAPIIGLTLRHDRLDNFWFTLLHELAHVGWHLGNDQKAFFDVLDAPAGADEIEAEADQLAGDALIPPEEWRSTDVCENPQAALVREFAQSIQRHPAIIAGRIRRDTGNYHLCSKLVGNRQVRRLFE